MKVPVRPALGWWASIAILLVMSMALYTDLSRFSNPIGEKYVPPFAPGQNDFNYPYVGARALVAGVNPYRNDRPELTSTVFGVTRIGGVEYKQLYPPGHLLTLVPLALWKGAAWEEAARIWFHFNLAALLVLAALTWAIGRRLVETPLTPLWIPLLYVCLTLNPGTEMALERGQSDIFMSLLCWAAVLCFLRGASGAAVFLAIWGASMKGYALLFAAGLGLLGLGRGRRRQTLVGIAVAAAVWVLPTVRYFGDAVHAVRFRSEMFEAVWNNHSFRNLVYAFAPEWAERGRLVLSAFALAVAALAWLQARRASRDGTPVALTLWLSMFTLASLGTMIGYSAFSLSYNLILLFPGALILGISQERLRSFLGLSTVERHTLGATLLGCLFLLFACLLRNTSAVGLAALFPIMTGLLIRGHSRSRSAKMDADHDR